MKKLSILLIAIIAFSVNSFSKEGEEYNVLWVMNNASTNEEVAKYVDATPEQARLLEDINYASLERLKDALYVNNKEDAQKALLFNIANVKNVLSPAQYRKYLEILNMTYFNQQNKFNNAAGY